MLGNLNGWHLVIILVVILLLFGATRLPALSKSLGQSMRIFRSETKAMKEENADQATPPVETTPPAAPAAPAAPPASGTAPSEATIAPETKSEPKS
ncbi:Sec-independent protein translocase subunit TatA [Herbiconiux sp. CPCC 205763]|uniref:Sec-independent protein translocase protein TatA n=1 Tax=Herbiconiux aconitum TaxID=2970913 RepID=A0ABT2GT90_9MICO|nr:Sec-independent protein translocase subunit TatA [Herbiconiux aconitum]MCS5719393.1 Sec-independent protein translocase subunit TatA [Herbiconiux aconitum]